MAALSKVYCSCYELGHTWTPYCSKASLDVALFGYAYAFKIYATLYLLAAFLRRRKKEDYLKRILPDILRSTLFLGTNAVVFMGSFCVWRKVVGFYFFYNVFACGIPAGAIACSVEKKSRRIIGCFYLTSVYIPAASASYLAICLERKSRRGVLAVYMLNVACETAYRMAASRGMAVSIPNGEVLLFSIVTAVYMYLFRTRNGLKDTIISGIKLLIGVEELPSSGEEEKHRIESSHRRKKFQFQIPPFVKELMNKLRHNLTKHHLCKHKYSCTSYCIEGSLRCFGIGFGIQLVFQLAKSLAVILRKPRALLDAIKSKNNFKLGAFLASFTGLFRLVNCLLRWIRNKDEKIHGAVAGFAAGWSMMFYKSTTITLWLASKLSEILYFKGIDAGIFPHIRYADIIIYTVCTSLVFHAAVFEPHNLRPAYWSFLQRITDNKFGQMNRNLIECYGTQATKMFPGYKPNYDPRFTDL